MLLALVQQPDRRARRLALGDGRLDRGAEVVEQRHAATLTPGAVVRGGERRLVLRDASMASRPQSAAATRVQLLQLGGLANAFGNGAVLPFALIYLHNVQGIGLGTAGLVLATNGFVSIASGPVGGVLVDRLGGKAVLASALVFLAIGYAGYVLVDSAWKGFVVATVTGIGNGLFWPAQSTLITVLTPRSVATRRSRCSGS